MCYKTLYLFLLVVELRHVQPYTVRNRYINKKRYNQAMKPFSNLCVRGIEEHETGILYIRATLRCEDVRKGRQRRASKEDM